MDIQSNRRRAPDCDTQGYLLVFARTAITLAKGIRKSRVFVCKMFPSRNSRMPHGVDFPHSKELSLKDFFNCGLECFVQGPFLAWSCGYQKHGMDKAALRSVGLASRVNLSAKIGSSRSGLREVAREDGLYEGAEDDVGTTTRY
jgi:hypothetical protein